MATFSYTARGTDGARTEGTLEATDRRTAMLQLERAGLVPVAVREAGAPPKRRPRGGRGGRSSRRRGPALPRTPARGAPRMAMAELLDFTTELSDLLAAGMKLTTALGSMAARRSAQGANAIILALHEDINRGTSLSEALAKHPTSFPRLYVSMIRAGEASGALPEILTRLVEHFERMRETREKVVMAMIYPSFILVAGVLTVVFVMGFVIPRFSKIFEDLGSTLPAPTRLLMWMSDALLNYWWAILIALGAACFLAHGALKSDKGRIWWHGAQLRLPLVRGVVAAAAFSQFARTLRTLLSNGVHVLQALRIVEQTMGNEVIARELRNARERVTDGTTISGPLAAGKVFPQLLTDMLAVGERTGDMAGALGHIARRYENQLDRNIKILMTALEPILILVIAVVVGFVAISMLLAVFEMTSGLNV